MCLAGPAGEKGRVGTKRQAPTEECSLIISMRDSSHSFPALSSTPLSSAVPSPALSTLSLVDPKEVTENDRQEAAQFKADANKAFICTLTRSNRIGCPLILPLPCPKKARDFVRAAQLYSEAISRNPSDATLFCNRAYTRIKLEEHGYALHDACEHRNYTSPLPFPVYEKLSCLPVCLLQHAQ